MSLLAHWMFLRQEDEPQGCTAARCWREDNYDDDETG